MSTKPAPKIGIQQALPSSETMLVVHDIVDVLAKNHRKQGRTLEGSAAEMFDVDIQIITGMMALVICRCNDPEVRNQIAERIAALLPVQVETTAQLNSAKRWANAH